VSFLGTYKHFDGFIWPKNQPKFFTRPLRYKAAPENVASDIRGNLDLTTLPLEREFVLKYYLAILGNFATGRPASANVGEYVETVFAIFGTVNNCFLLFNDTYEAEWKFDNIKKVS